MSEEKLTEHLKERGLDPRAECPIHPESAADPFAPKPAKPDPDNRLVPCKEAAEILDLPASWLRDEALAGRLPCLVTSKTQVHFNLSALRKTLLERAATEYVKPQSFDPTDPKHSKILGPTQEELAS